MRPDQGQESQAWSKPSQKEQAIFRPILAAALAGAVSAERRGTRLLGSLGVMHLENNEAPANDRGCVADASHVS